VVFAPGKYRLRFQYQTEGLAKQAGLHWAVSRDGIEETAGPVLARAAGGEHNVDWSFDWKKRGVYQLQVVYVRVPGTIHIQRRVELASVAFEML